jgi:ribonuclease VapC
VIAVDSSALIAILDDEPERAAFAAAIADADRLLVSAVSVHETGLVMFGRHRSAGLDDLWELLGFIGAEIVPFDEAQVRAALSAFARYGKGVDPKSRLNLGDCAAYALAKSHGIPLLFKGDDFRATDVAACI